MKAPASELSRRAPGGALRAARRKLATLVAELGDPPRFHRPQPATAPVDKDDRRERL